MMDKVFIELAEKVQEQIEDIALWSPPENSKEAYLQDALRTLHEIIETGNKHLVSDKEFRLWDSEEKL